MRRLLAWLVVLVLLALGGLAARDYVRRHPQDVPWTRLDLSRPVGAFTGRKLAALRDEPGRCGRLLGAAGIRFHALPQRRAGAHCGYDDAVRFAAGGSLAIAWRPADLGTSCGVAAGLALWEWHVVQPAALRHFGSRVAAIDHFGSYSCRRIAGRADGAWSEHATANAVDVAGFRLDNGMRITLVDDWSAGGRRAAFLREVRDGACGLFATVISPDYNRAHRDHFPLDQASRGARGWRGCW